MRVLRQGQARSGDPDAAGHLQVEYKQPAVVEVQAQELGAP
jgi:hypothetical protein